MLTATLSLDAAMTRAEAYGISKALDATAAHSLTSAHGKEVVQVYVLFDLRAFIWCTK